MSLDDRNSGGPGGAGPPGIGTGPSGVRVGTRRRSGFLRAGVIALVLLLGACSGSSSVRDTLLQASRDATAAVHTAAAALDALDKGRITRAVAQTALIDMTKQVASSADQVTQLELSAPGDQEMRDTVRAATAKGSSAVVAGRDCLQLKISCQPAKDQLNQAATELDKIVSELRSAS